MIMLCGSNLKALLRAYQRTSTRGSGWIEVTRVAMFRKRSYIFTYIFSKFYALNFKLYLFILYKI